MHLDLVRELQDRVADPDRFVDDKLQRHQLPLLRLTTKALRRSERQLGFPMAPELREVLVAVGNGGWGPGYGLLGVEGGFGDDFKYDSVQRYLGFRQPPPNDSAWQWPEGLLPTAYLGCAMYLCVSCLGEVGKVVWFEPNPRELGQPLDRFLIPLYPSVSSWLEAWLRGEDPLVDAAER